MPLHNSFFTPYRLLDEGEIIFTSDVTITVLIEAAVQNPQIYRIFRTLIIKFKTFPGSIDPIIRGMIMQNLKLPDGKLSDSVTERLFHVVAQVALDLAAINIQRGRDHAIPTYNDMRQVCGMRRALNFHDLQV